MCYSTNLLFWEQIISLLVLSGRVLKGRFSFSQWFLSSPSELEISVLLTQTENQGHSGLSTQLWSGKICGDQWLLELARPDTKKSVKRRHFGDGSLPALHCFYREGGCSMALTPSHLCQQKGQLPMWPMCLLPLVPPGLHLHVGGLW